MKIKSLWCAKIIRMLSRSNLSVVIASMFMVGASATLAYSFDPDCNGMQASTYPQGGRCDGGQTCPAFNSSLPYGGCGASTNMTLGLIVAGKTHCVAAPVGTGGVPVASYCTDDLSKSYSCTALGTCAPDVMLNPDWTEGGTEPLYLDICSPFVSSVNTNSMAFEALTSPLCVQVTIEMP